MTYDRISQIGNGPGMRVEKRSDPILIRGICRIGEGPRMFNPLSEPLAVKAIVRPVGISIEGTLSEAAPASVELFDLTGRLLWSDCTTAQEGTQRRFVRQISPDVLSGVGIVIVRTERQQASTLVVEVSR
jgi:hypothetical protein